MAWSFVNSYTSTTNKSAGTADTASVTASVGDILVALCACDDISGSDAIGTTAVTDASSNTWTRKASNQGQGGASSTCAAIFTTTVGTGLSSQNVTFTPDSGSAAKAFIVLRFTGGSETVRNTTGTTNGDATSTSIAHTGVTSGDLVVGTVACERTSGDTYTGDTDTDSGSWSSIIKNGTASGGAASNQTVIEQYKIATATATQTWDPSWANTLSFRGILIALEPGGGGGGSETADAEHSAVTGTSNAAVGGVAAKTI